MSAKDAWMSSIAQRQVSMDLSKSAVVPSLFDICLSSPTLQNLIAELPLRLGGAVKLHGAKLEFMDAQLEWVLEKLKAVEKCGPQGTFKAFMFSSAGYHVTHVTKLVWHSNSILVLH